MTTQPRHDAREQGDVTTERGVYVYGIIWSPDDLPADLPSVGDDKAPVRLASHRGLSALVSEVPLARPLGTRQDLLAHERVLDTLAEETTVLPMRFGSVVSTVDAVTDELLAPHHEHFESVLSELDGLVQLTVRGKYTEDAHLREVVTEEPEIMRLRESLQGVAEDAGYSERVRLGELVNEAVAKKRQSDGEDLVRSLEPAAVASASHEVGGVEDAVDAAFLVDRRRVPEFERAVDELAERWTGRVSLRLLGPLAPYDFLPES
ncbi:GvpL/GvpF family gas vesicle protein [Saccharopolyspora erythraea]|uniref:GvpL/GvpF family gas vesicle protein n=1 Tax=Saccharopolyspora erythraea TaxID=1836 RepID=UPI001BA8E305|nr:GvpL/GvpF family gas vesicle protein [Saccharopolyspora erythraea]QUH00233.1 GvpL/GvpF family gas vesicle protein [Saccharopolyspora erythraea]